VAAAFLDADAAAVVGVGRSPRDDACYTHDLEWLGRRVPAPVPEPLARAARDPRYGYVALDVRDAGAVADLARDVAPDAVVHAAAALRDAPWEDLLQSNVVATLGLVRGLAAAPGRPRVVIVSSGSVYGAGRGVLPLAEDGPVEPYDPYGATKRAAEDVARVAAADAGLPLVVARVFNLVGPGLQERHLPGMLAARISAIARGLAPPKLELGPLSATRDFVDVRDAATAIVLIASAPAPPPMVNVASGAETPAQRVLDLLLELAGSPAVAIRSRAGRRTDAPRLVADVRRLTALGFVPRHDLRETLADMLVYFDAFAAR
jgi:nucleoside-diphosphate-sugar epimerase